MSSGRNTQRTKKRINWITSEQQITYFETPDKRNSFPVTPSSLLRPGPCVPRRIPGASRGQDLPGGLTAPLVAPISHQPPPVQHGVGFQLLLKVQGLLRPAGNEQLASLSQLAPVELGTDPRSWRLPKQGPARVFWEGGKAPCVARQGADDTFLKRQRGMPRLSTKPKAASHSLNIHNNQQGLPNTALPCPSSLAAIPVLFVFPSLQAILVLKSAAAFFFSLKSCI